MRNLTPILLAAFGIISSATSGSAQIVSNSDFTANVGDFIYYPGYSGDNNTKFTPDGMGGYTAMGGYSNAPIEDWTSTNVNQTGINQKSAPQDLGYGPPFGPYGGVPAGGPNVFAFIQRNGSLSQSINLTATYRYQLSFQSAPRANNTTDATVTISFGGVTYVTANANDDGQTTFTTPITMDFTALGNSTISLNNVDPSGADLTESFANVTITQIGVPEPATYGLLAMGMVGLCVVARARRRD